MPFIGVSSGREWLFQPAPQAAIAVSDAAAWRLNPGYRQVYNRLDLAVYAGLTAAPCGVAPSDYGIAPAQRVFVKPIVNLAGMALGARALPAAEVPCEAGSFWCECLAGEASSSDCLVRDGEPLWFVHAVGSHEQNAARALYWDVGVARPALEPILTGLIHTHLAGYTGLCNIELIGGRPIEIHLRGSNGFFELYGPDFLPAWVALVDFGSRPLVAAIPGGVIVSVFAEGRLDAKRAAYIRQAEGNFRPTPEAPGRVGVVCCRDREQGYELARQLAAG